MQKNKVIMYTIPIVFWGGIWYFVCAIINNPLLLPSPLAVFTSLIQLIYDKVFWLNVSNSLMRIVLGFVLGVALGMIFAVLSHMSKLFRLIINPLISVIKATPMASIIILLLVWITSKNLSVVLVLLVVLPNIYSNTLKGLQQVDPKLLEMAFVFKMNKRNRIRYIYLPKVMEFLLPAVSFSLGFSWKSGISGEVLAQPVNTIGEALYYSKVYLNTPALFAYTLFIVGISIVMEKVIIRFIKGFEKGVSYESRN
ncbi:NitT/TauT family transport system permease protein [Alkalibaculum bacchi]|uniref:NitT/TauT family transport system permease protein n=1 Tax=Alkalibaculum bacchi TaxID=645887 RepID=A0A366HYJ1_9FIRM|nr:ABC transporter permease subunit [Alkalibaculum bacchi]RBP59101.1 NitT/TauT family transport system permease protein [Alkalibaculum bacchi]